MAVTSSTVWEVWSTGAAANGGGFDPTVVSPGTDYSQQAAAQKTYTDLVINAVTNTNATSAAQPFTASDVGNVYNITSGAGFTVQRVVLISVAAGVGTFNASLGTLSSTGGNATMGGAVDNLTRPAAVAGNTVYVKATATYTITASNTFATAGTLQLPIAFIGYTSSRTDNGYVTVQASTNVSITVFNVTAGRRRFKNFIADCNGLATSTGFAVSGNFSNCENCKALNFTTAGFTSFPFGFIKGCIATGGTAAATAAFNLTGQTPICIGCIATGNVCPGFITNSAGSSAITLIGCIAANNTGASSDGFRNNGTSAAAYFNCDAYANGRHGLLMDTAANLNAANVTVFNCIFVNNGGYGISSNSFSFGTLPTTIPMDFNAFYNNTSGARQNVAAGLNDVTLTADPFTSGAANDFTLNNTAGAGAASKSVGYQYGVI